MGTNVGITFRLTNDDHPHFLDSEVHSHSQISQIGGQTLNLSNIYAQTICSHYLSPCRSLGLTYKFLSVLQLVSDLWSPPVFPVSGFLQGSCTLYWRVSLSTEVGNCSSCLIPQTVQHGVCQLLYTQTHIRELSHTEKYSNIIQ